MTHWLLTKLNFGECYVFNVNGHSLFYEGVNIMLNVYLMQTGVSLFKWSCFPEKYILLPLQASNMEQPVPVKEVKILETAEDIQERREQVKGLLINIQIQSLI